MATWGEVVAIAANPEEASYGLPARFGRPGDPMVGLYALPGWSDLYQGAVALGLCGLGQSMPGTVYAITQMLRERYSPKQVRTLSLRDDAAFLQDEAERRDAANQVAGQTPPPAGPEKEEKESPAGKPKPKRGPKVRYDPKEDRRIYEAWMTNSYRDFKDLARNLGSTCPQVKRAIDRHRKRQAQPPE
jgi:hypothetical protein